MNLPNDIIRIGHRHAVVLKAEEDRLLVKDTDGNIGYLEVTERQPVEGHAGEGLFTHLTA